MTNTLVGFVIDLKLVFDGEADALRKEQMTLQRQLIRIQNDLLVREQRASRLRELLALGGRIDFCPYCYFLSGEKSILKPNGSDGPRIDFLVCSSCGEDYAVQS